MGKETKEAFKDHLRAIGSELKGVGGIVSAETKKALKHEKIKEGKQLTQASVAQVKRTSTAKFAEIKELILLAKAAKTEAELDVDADSFDPDEFVVGDVDVYLLNRWSKGGVEWLGDIDENDVADLYLRSADEKLERSTEHLNQALRLLDEATEAREQADLIRSNGAE